MHLLDGRSGAAGPIAEARSVIIHAEAIPLDAEHPAVREVGALHFVAGWSLTSDDKSFGGWSGLVVSPDGASLTAISDQGNWLTARLDITAGNPLTQAVIQPFEASAENNDKADYDAEGLLAAADGRFLVSFEQDHRLHYALPGGGNERAPYSDLIDLTGISRNKGLEAITWAGDGRLLAFIEQGSDPQGRLPAWLVGETKAERLSLRPPQNFLPTDAATLPNGDILLLTRYYSVLNGVAAKLLLIPADRIYPGAELEGQELATLVPPLSVDNMEGLAVVGRPGRPPLVFMMSDDNFRATQRTLLLVFELKTP